MSTFSWDNYLDIIVLPDGTIEKNDISVVEEESYEVDEELEDTIQQLLAILDEFPGSQNAKDAMAKLKLILFDTYNDEHDDNLEEYI